MPTIDWRNTASTVGQGVGAPILVIAILAMMVMPLPPLALDMFFTFNIAFSLIILLVVVYVMRPLEFGAFPTVLLVATLMRLALNIASTRVVLLEGHSGSQAAGKVIESFGNFVIGGNYAVGLVVFAILVIINFVVVTKGAGRISEVSARFTLDALPGKQMAIDADLNAGLINQEEARVRRVEVAAEAEFYGAMDGSSKFVRGDAIAGIVILFINIIGGLCIGTLQHGLDFGTAVENYVLLTIGDGLVAQIPSLVLSTAAAVIITRVSKSGDMGKQMVGQLFDNPRPLIVTAAILLVVGVVPGMPNFAFLTLGVLAASGAAWLHYKRSRKPATPEVADETLPEGESMEARDLSWDDVKAVDVVGLEVGYGLIPLVDKAQGGQLMNRIKGVRKKLSQELGFLVQPVHIADNLSLSPSAYRISVLGVAVGEAEIHAGKHLAINPGTVYGELDGIAGEDPAFGLPAVWIDDDQRDLAQVRGYTVVDASTVIATHLSKLLKENAHKLLGHDEAQQLLDKLAESAPRLVDGLVPDELSLSVVVRVLQSLLEESVPIRDMRTITEILSANTHLAKDPAALLAQVREGLGRLIVQQVADKRGDLPIVTLTPAMEQMLLKVQGGDGQPGTGLEPGLAEHLYQQLRAVAETQESRGAPTVLAVAPALRPVLARLLRQAVRSVNVLAFNEIPDDWNVEIVASVGG
ncbi:MAG: flagellar biosynthesis protein FlhA [Pseudomonadota bacterium]